MLAGGTDVNARNENGHTPIIHAIVAGQYHLLSLLLNAGANPILPDSTGLTAIDWAERKGRPDLAQSLKSPATLTSPVDSQAHISRQRAVDEAERKQVSDNEKSRRFIAGLRQRLEEQASRESANLEPPASESEPPKSRSTFRRARTSEEPKDEPKREAAPAVTETVEPAIIAPPDLETLRPSSSIISPSDFDTHSSPRKRCPQCGTTYSSELLAYCVYHEVALVAAAEPVAIPPAENRSSLLWALVLIAIVLGGMTGLFLTRDLFKNATINTPAPASSAATTQKGIPTLEKELSGKEVSLPQAEVPPNTVREPTTITVRVRVDRDGRVSAASANGGDQVLRDAALKAARNATFSVRQLRARRAEGNINYTFQ